VSTLESIHGWDAREPPPSQTKMNLKEKNGRKMGRISFVVTFCAPCFFASFLLALILTHSPPRSPSYLSKHTNKLLSEQCASIEYRNNEDFTREVPHFVTLYLEVMAEVGSQVFCKLNGTF
jgi:hypothetical protein